jgi:hypothetical protein
MPKFNVGQEIMVDLGLLSLIGASQQVVKAKIIDIYEKNNVLLYRLEYRSGIGAGGWFPENMLHNTNEIVVQENHLYPAIEIRDGLKIEVKERVVNELLEHKELNEEFQLNIKRKNRWYWSVYFKAK